MAPTWGSANQRPRAPVRRCCARRPGPKPATELRSSPGPDLCRRCPRQEHYDTQRGGLGSGREGVRRAGRRPHAPPLGPLLLGPLRNLTGRGRCCTGVGQRPATGQTSGLLGTAARDAWLARRSGRQRWARPLAALTGAGLVTLSILASGGSSALGAVVAASSGSDFNPVSVTFVSLRAGWALGSAP